MPLPTVVVIGAMKCGTTALHRYLAAHPDVSMARAKEVGFFDHHWDDGIGWYADRVPEGVVRGESSPGYTSPDHPCVPGRMARVLPEARIVYLVRDPLERAVSQYAHHRRDGAEQRPPAEALLDPAGHYLLRSRFHERLAPFLDVYDAEQVLVVVAERLRRHRRRELARVFAHVGADPDWWDPVLEEEWHVGGAHPAVPPDVAGRFRARVHDDVGRLEEHLGDLLPEWAA